MEIPIFARCARVILMHAGVATVMVTALLAASLPAEIKRQERRSLLDSEPDVVYLDQVFKEPVELKVIKEAPVFSDKEGRHRLGTLKANPFGCWMWVRAVACPAWSWPFACPN